MAANHKVFVYGTLKHNEPNHFWLTDPENGVGNFIGTGVTVHKYPLIIASKYNIPFILYSRGNGHHVKGEVYEVDEKMLSKLDILEDHPTFYEREIEDIVVTRKNTNEETTEQCWVYFLKKFKRGLLSHPTMDNYSSIGPHGLQYVERLQRTPAYHARIDVKEDNPL